MLQQCNFCPVCESWLKAMWKQQQEQLAHASTTHVGCVVVKRERVVHVEFPVCVCWDLFGLDDLTASALRAFGFWILVWIFTW